MTLGKLSTRYLNDAPSLEHLKKQMQSLEKPQNRQKCMCLSSNLAKGDKSFQVLL